MSFSAPGFGLIQDIDVRLTVELGRVDMCLRDVLAEVALPGADARTLPAGLPVRVEFGQ